MSYFFASNDALVGFADLSQALRGVGRSPFILPPVYRRAFDVGAGAAAPHI